MQIGLGLSSSNCWCRGSVNLGGILFLLFCWSTILILSGSLLIELLIGHQVKVVPNALFECLDEPRVVVSHKNLVSILSNALVVEELHKGSLRLEVVSFDLAESGDKLKALAVVECVMHLQWCWLQIVVNRIEQ